MEMENICPNASLWGVHGGIFVNGGHFGLTWRRARIPVSLLAVVGLLMSVGMVSYMNYVNTRPSGEPTVAMLEKCAQDIQSDVILQAYYIACDTINSTIDPTRLVPSAQMKFASFLMDYPKKIEHYRIDIVDHEYSIVFEAEDTTDYMHGNDIRYDGVLKETGKTMYFRVVGFVSFNLTDVISGRVMTKIAVFDKNIYTPYPFLKGALDYFQANSVGEFTDMGRLVKFILTTLAQFKTLTGIAGGKYGASPATPISSVITSNDVYNALFLAALVEQARVFRDFDRGAASSIGASAVLDGFLNNGTIDAADLYLLFKNLYTIDVDIGKMLGQTIYTYVDEFLFDLYCKFWGGLTSELYIDPFLQEPLRSFDFTKTLEMIDEPLAKRCLWWYLYQLIDWMGISPAGQDGHYFPGFSATASLHNITEFFQGDDANCGGPLNGNYDLFSVPDVATWTVFAHEVNSIEYLILGEGTNPNYEPVPYVVSYSDNGWSGLGIKPVCYYLVHQSLVRKHSEPGSMTPYQDTLRYITQVMNNSMRLRADSHSSKGMLDLMASDAASAADSGGLESAQVFLGNPGNVDSVINPKNERTTLREGSDAIISELEDAAGDFKAKALSERERWWREGAYKQGQDGFLWAMFKESVDLVYEAFDTLQKSASATEHFDQAALEPVQSKPSVGAAFNFRNDAMKDLYRRVFPIADARISEFNDAYWTYITGHPEHSSPPVCPTVWDVNYAEGYGSPEEHLWTELHDMAVGALDTVFTNGVLGYITSAGIMNKLNSITDSRSYGSGFYLFITHTCGIGEVFINDDGTIMRLANYWLVEAFAAMREHILRNADLTNLEFFQRTSVGVPIELWRGDRKEAYANKSVMFEVPRVLQTDMRVDRLDISTPGLAKSNRLRIADVQDGEWNTSLAPFQSYWRFDISAKLDLSVFTERYSLISEIEKTHMRTFVNQSISIKLNFPVVTFTSWNLDDLEYWYARGYFGMSASDTHLMPFFVSRDFHDLLDTAESSVDVMLEGLTKVARVSAPVMYEFYEKKNQVPEALDDGLRSMTSGLKALGEAHVIGVMGIFDELISDCASTGVYAFPAPMLGLMDAEFDFEGYMIRLSDQYDYDDMRIDYGRDMQTRGLLRFSNFEGSFEILEPSADFHMLGLFDIYGLGYTYELSCPSSVSSEGLVSTRSMDVSENLTGIYIPLLGEAISANLAIFGSFTQEQLDHISGTMNESKNELGNSPEHLITFLKCVLGAMYDTIMADRASKTLNTSKIGVCFETEGTRHINYSILFTDGQELNATMVGKFIEWLINQIRSYIYSTGGPDDAATPMAALAWRTFEHSNRLIRTRLDHIYADMFSRAEMNMHAIMEGLPFANSEWDGVFCGEHDLGKHTRNYYAEFGVGYGSAWTTYGTLVKN